jgi:hypothetical protein
MKVFCLGLSRTGTSSLHAASVILRMPAIHYPIELAHRWFNGDFSISTTEPYQFISDLPTPLFFEEFDFSHPGARFILTYRPVDRWLDSVERHFRATQASSTKTVPRDLVRLACYGTTVFHKQRMLSLYQRHLDRVSRYFASRPGDLLTINIDEEKNPWAVLCKFLQLPVPEFPFPHLRTPITGSLKRCKPEEVENKRTAILNLLIENSIEAQGVIPPMPKTKGS